MISSMHPHSNNSNSPSNLNNSGKGTRPKRGKYRNYDRDSLVEAVKAVQRGEMSVHRAGSYYGVPHSTLEYKVKERHLMRPRKREPKPQPLESSGGSTSSISSVKSHDLIGSVSRAQYLPILIHRIIVCARHSVRSGAIAFTLELLQRYWCFCIWCRVRADLTSHPSRRYRRQRHQ